MVLWSDVPVWTVELHPHFDNSLPPQPLWAEVTLLLLHLASLLAYLALNQLEVKCVRHFHFDIQLIDNVSCASAF
jgi:hypothetical protein